MLALWDLTDTFRVLKQSIIEGSFQMYRGTSFEGFANVQCEISKLLTEADRLG